jgi:hypothetical protein
VTASVGRTWSPAQSDRLVGLFQEGHDPAAIAINLQRAERYVREELLRRGGPALWRPRCMTDEEYDSWSSKNAPMTLGKALRPCADCPLGYAADMRAEGRCNGTPGGVEEDEGDMATQPPPQIRAGAIALQPTPNRTLTTDVAVALDLPCPSCIHAPVCRIKASIEGQLDRLAVATPRLDPALTIQLEAKVDCSLFRPERPAKRGGGPHGQKRNLSPEERERRRQQALAMTAAKRAT